MAKPAKPGSRSGSSLGLLVAVLLLTIAAAGAGLAVGTMVQLPEIASATTDSMAAAEPAPGHDSAAVADETPSPQADHEEMKVVPFPPILTSLAEPQGTWIRLDGSMLLTADSEEKPDILVERAGTQILTYLRTVKLSQIEGPSGLLHLRENLNDTVSVLSGGQIREVLIHSMVVE